MSTLEDEGEEGDEGEEDAENPLPADDIKEASSHPITSPQLDPDQLGMRLLEAAKKGDMMEAESVLLSNADIHYKDPATTAVPLEGSPDTWRVLGCMALHWAAMHNKVEMITFLLQRGADINRQDDREYCKWTALHWASVLGKAESASILLHNKAHVECRDDRERTALHCASQQGYADLVEILLQNNADLHSQGKTEWTPLHYASREGHVEVVAILLHHNADIHSTSTGEWTPLHYASEEGHAGVVAMLLHHNANVHSKNKDESTALHIASANGHVKVVAILLRHNADIQVNSKDGDSPLHHASYSGKSAVMELLLASKADPTIKNKAGILPGQGCLVSHRPAIEKTFGRFALFRNNPKIFEAHRVETMNKAVETEGKAIQFMEEFLAEVRLRELEGKQALLDKIAQEERSAIEKAELAIFQAEKAKLQAEEGKRRAEAETAAIREERDEMKKQLDQSEAARQRERQKFKKQLDATETLRAQEHDELVKRLEVAERQRDQVKEALQINTAEKEEATLRADQATVLAQRLQGELDDVRKELQRTTISLNERDRDVLVAVLDRSKNVAQRIVSKNDRASLEQAQSAFAYYQQLSDRVPKSVFAVPDIPTIRSSDLQIKAPVGGGVGGMVLRVEWTVPQGKPQRPPMAWKAPHTDTRDQGRIEADVWKTCPPHPNLITLRAVVKQDDGVFDGVLMDLCNQSLDKAKLGAVELMQCAQEITRGLAHLHSCKILHRDLAPRNILMQRIGQATRYAITDFGLSRTLDVNYLYERTGTGPGVALPWRTLAPEIHRARIRLLKQSGGKEDEQQGKGTLVFGKPSDIWALGVTLWELATNQRAYANERGQAQEIQEKIGNGIIKLDVEPLISTHRELAPAIIGCLQHDPKSRPTAPQLLLLLNDDPRLAARLYGDYTDDIKNNTRS